MLCFSPLSDRTINGLPSGVVPPPPPAAPFDGGWITKHVEDYQRRQEKDYQASEARLKAEIDEKAQLLALIQSQMEPKLAEEQQQQASKKSRAQFYPSLELQDYFRQISLLNMQMQELERQLLKLPTHTQDEEEALLLLIA